MSVLQLSGLLAVKQNFRLIPASKIVLIFGADVFLVNHSQSVLCLLLVSLFCWLSAISRCTDTVSPGGKLY